MNTTQKIRAFFSPSKEDLFLPNEYTPPKGLSDVKQVKTIQPDERVEFNEVFNNANKQLTQ
jgi:hypothetical protein